MIQSPSLSTLSMIPAAGDMPVPALPDGAELADFGALLALTASQAAPAAPAVPAGTVLPGEVSPANATLAEAAIPGKSLPLSLPLAVPIAEPETVAVKPKTTVPDPCDLPPPSQPLTKTGVPIQRVLGKDKILPESDAASAMEAAPALPDAALPALAQPELPTAPATAPVLSAAPPLPGQVPVMEEPREPKGERPPQGGGAAPQPAASALAHANPHAAFLRTEAPGRRRAEPVAAPPAAQSASTQPPASAPQAIAQVRVEVIPAVPVMRALAKDDLRPAPAATLTAPLSELAANTVTTSAPTASIATPVPLLHQPMPLADRPQDFSALIDRLVAAREAAGPQAVAVSLAHAEFGQVHLRFRQDEAGLSVAMASADPAFARAASAMPPVLPVSDAQSGQFQQGQRQDSSAAAGQPGSGQQRGSTGERQNDQPQGNQPQRRGDSDHSPSARPHRRGGIFA